MTEDVQGSFEFDGEPEDIGLRKLLEADPRWSSRYEGWFQIGRGAFATVVKTYCKDLGADVAVKVFKDLDQDDRRRFQQEILNARRLDLPGVVRMYSPFWGATPWVEMEWVDGPNLKEELRRRAAADEPLPFPNALDIAIALTEVVAEAHRKRLVHRDIKPANILLPRSRDPLVKLADFGIARAEGSSKMTKTGTMPGTPQFGSPESITGDKPLTSAHDVYSLGLCLYVLFTGYRFPWNIQADAAPRRWFHVHVEVSPKTARLHVPELDRELDDLLLRCLRKKPEKRPKVDDVLATLRKIKARHVAAAATGVAPSRGAGRRATGPVAAAAVGLVLIAVALAVRRVSAPRPVTASSPAPPSVVAASVNPALRPPTTTSTTPGVSQDVPLPPEIRGVSIRGRAVQVRNGNEKLADVAIEVEDGGTTHRCHLGAVAAGEELFCAFADFEPPLGDDGPAGSGRISFKLRGKPRSVPVALH